MTKLTPRDIVKKNVSEILKRVDRLIKAGSVDQAIREIINAKDIDPSNAYISAYEQRLEFLRSEHEKHAAEEILRKDAERMAQERDEELRRRQEEDDQSFLQELERLSEENRQLESQQTQNDEPGISRILESDKILPEGISDRHQPKVEIQSQTTSNNLIQDQKRDRANTVLVIDDDEDMLKAIEHMLSNHYINVTALTTTDEALALLQKWTPELILCDVNLETSTMGGFSFYESIRRLEHLNQVPFIFLTGLTDQILIRTGKEMGVDDYITKPVSEENLIAAVKGKIKRFALLNRK